MLDFKIRYVISGSMKRFSRKNFTYSPKTLWSAFSRVTVMPLCAQTERTYLSTNV